MRAVNFRLSATRYLLVGKHDIDLHNDFEFVSVTHDVVQQMVMLLWRRCEQSNETHGLPKLVSLRCEGVAAFSVEPSAPSMPSSEARCLSSIGYCSAEEPSQFWVEEAPQPQWAWSFQFQSGSQFRITGSEAYATIEP